MDKLNGINFLEKDLTKIFPCYKYIFSTIDMNDDRQCEVFSLALMETLFEHGVDSKQVYSLLRMLTVRFFSSPLYFDRLLMCDNTLYQDATELYNVLKQKYPDKQLSCTDYFHVTCHHDCPLCSVCANDSKRYAAYLRHNENEQFLLSYLIKADKNQLIQAEKLIRPYMQDIFSSRYDLYCDDVSMVPLVLNLNYLLCDSIFSAADKGITYKSRAFETEICNAVYDAIRSSSAPFEERDVPLKHNPRLYVRRSVGAILQQLSDQCSSSLTSTVLPSFIKAMLPSNAVRLNPSAQRYTEVVSWRISHNSPETSSEHTKKKPREKTSSAKKNNRRKRSGRTYNVRGQLAFNTITGVPTADSTSSSTTLVPSSDAADSHINLSEKSHDLSSSSPEINVDDTDKVLNSEESVPKVEPNPHLKDDVNSEAEAPVVSENVTVSNDAPESDHLLPPEVVHSEKEFGKDVSHDSNDDSDTSHEVKEDGCTTPVSDPVSLDSNPESINDRDQAHEQVAESHGAVVSESSSPSPDHDVTEPAHPDETNPHVSVSPVIKEDQHPNRGESSEPVEKKNESDSTSANAGDHHKKDKTMFFPIRIKRSDISDFAEDIASKAVLDRFYNGVFQDQRLYLEAFIDEDNNPLILFFCHRLNSFFYTSFSNAISNDIVFSFLRHNSIPKVCYQPFVLYSICSFFHVFARNVTSLELSSHILFKTLSVSTLSDTVSRLVKGVGSHGYVSAIDEIRHTMPLYKEAYRNSVRQINKGSKSNLLEERSNYWRTLGYMFLIFEPENTTRLFKLGNDRIPLFMNRERLLSRLGNSYVTRRFELVLEEKFRTQMSGLIIRLLAKLAEKGISTRCRFFIFEQTDTTLSLFVHRDDADELHSSILDLIEYLSSDIPNIRFSVKATVDSF